MVRHLRFMGAEFREGRPQVAPQRKDHERILGEDIDWQLAETAREEVDDEEIDLKLMKEAETAAATVYECQTGTGHGESDRGVEELRCISREVECS